MMRFAVFIICLVGSFFLPWWLALGMLLVPVVLYRRFFEALVPAFFIDVIHGGMLADPLVSSTLWIALALLALLFAESYLRDHIRA